MAEYIEREALLHESNADGAYGYVDAKQIADAPAADVVPIDDMFGEMMNWAVRYALGRRTYAASDTARYITPLVPKLSNKALWAMREDLKPNTPWNPLKDYGDPCDKAEWMKLLDAVNAELDRRKTDG